MIYVDEETLMKTIALFLGLMLLTSVSHAQLTPPSGFNASHNSDGVVSLSWNAPALTGNSSIRDLIEWPESNSEKLDWDRPDPEELIRQWEEMNTRDELDDLVFYFLYRNGEPIDIVWDTEYVDELPQTGTYTYAVSAFYDGGESPLTDELVITWYDQVNFVINEDFNDGDMPDGWIVEASHVSHTWHVGESPWQFQDDFPTPVMFVDSDRAGSQLHLQERLILPNFDFSETNLVELSFDFFLEELSNEHCYIEYRYEGGEWIEFADYSTEGVFMDQVVDMSGPLAGRPDVDICYYYDDYDNWGWFCGFDDLLLQRDTVNPDPVVLDVIGMETDIPASGGVVGYDLSIVSQLPNTVQNVKYWATVTTPNGNESEPVAFASFTHTPNMEAEYRYLQLEVPFDAIPGVYTYNAYLGLQINDPPMVEDSFTFTKQGAGNGMDEYVVDPAEWITIGLSELMTGENNLVALPSAFAMHTAYPNPFNAMTTLTLQLPEASVVSLVVYNTLGQEVASLVNSQLQAGSHDVVFDASGMASGLYFVRMEVPGQISQMQKIVLMK
jgi:Secretion system C-terminal sorting domain